MSVIVKGGGGKSSGLYVWAKYNADIGLGESINNIALANDGTSIDIYVKENLYIKEDGTIGVQGEPYSTVSISSVVEDTCIGGMTPTKYCIGVDGNVYSSPLSHIAGSVDNCLANLVKVVKSTFIDFVVSDSETAYPDGAVHTDGYWYEKVKLAPDNGISFDDIRPSTDSNYPYAPQTMKIKMDNIPEYFMSSGSMVSYASDKNLGGLLTRVEIDSGIIGNSAFRHFFKGLGKTAKAKVILNCESIGEYCFNSIGYSAGYSVSIYITSKCTKILTGTTASHAPFNSADSGNVKLYLEASSAPSGFETYWNNYSNGSTNTLSTMYGVTREAFEAL